jgi:endonuclease-3
LKGGIFLANKRITKKERERMDRIIDALNREYKMEYRCFLNYETPWQLLIATILSAQCTDNRVNIVTKDLFQKYRSLKDFAEAKQEELEKDIHSTGFYKNKAKNIIACAKKLVEEYACEVPNDIELLTNLAGVGRKTANVIRGNIYGEPSIVVDTHVKRISKRLGFTKAEDPVKIEYDLMALLPKEQWILYNIQIITLGRSICTARNPKCSECFLKEECIYVNNPSKFENKTK